MSTAPSASPKPVTSTADLAQLVAKCLDLYKAAATTGDTHAVTEACGAAIRASGLSSADFWAKYHPTANSSSPTLLQAPRPPKSRPPPLPTRCPRAGREPGRARR